VENYADFVEYLMQKGGGEEGGVETVYLQFKGRNKVLYRLQGQQQAPVKGGSQCAGSYQ
jgi:hypothetical protein